MKYPISIFLFISMFFVCSCAGLGGFPLYSGSYGSQAASRLTPVEIRLPDYMAMSMTWVCG